MEDSQSQNPQTNYNLPSGEYDCLSAKWQRPRDIASIYLRGPTFPSFDVVFCFCFCQESKVSNGAGHRLENSFERCILLRSHSVRLRAETQPPRLLTSLGARTPLYPPAGREREESGATRNRQLLKAPQL